MNSSSEKFLKKYFNLRDTKELVSKLKELPDEKFTSLSIKISKLDSPITWRKQKTTINEVLENSSLSDKRAFIIYLFQSRLEWIDDDADTLSQARSMKEPGSIFEGAWIDSAYSYMLTKDRMRRSLLRHLLEQLI
jgi:hypothetical protein